MMRSETDAAAVFMCQKIDYLFLTIKAIGDCPLSEYWALRIPERLNQAAGIIICAEFAVRHPRAKPAQATDGSAPRIHRPVVGRRGLTIGPQELDHEQHARQRRHKGKWRQHLPALGREQCLRAAQLLEQRIVGLAD